MTVYFPPSLEASLRAYGESRGIGLCDVVRTALAQYLTAAAELEHPPPSGASLPVESRATIQRSIALRKATRPSPVKVQVQPWRPDGCSAPVPSNAYRKICGPENHPPLAWTEQGDPIMPPRNAAAWRVERLDRISGKTSPISSPTAGPDDEPLVLDLHAPHAWLRRAVSNQSGFFRLTLLDASGRLLQAPTATACVE